MKKRMIPFLLLLVMTSMHVGADEQSWRFRVWLDDREIGYHDFVLQNQGGQELLHSQANFEYRMLFVKLYEYQHQNQEVWEGNCLRRIESQTDANGANFEVRGERLGDRFVIEQGADGQELPACVMSFAYWNPDFLAERQLLNSQNGKLVEIEVSTPEPDRLTVRGSEVPARRYRLEAEDLVLFLWYSEDQQWLALETEARGGRRLRYELL